MGERTVPDSVYIPPTDAGTACRGMVTHNADRSVHWVHASVRADTRTTPVWTTPLQRSAGRRIRNALPLDRRTAGRVRDPYVYRS